VPAMIKRDFDVCTFELSRFVKYEHRLSPFVMPY
jgi:hypothetical protein